MINDNKQSYFNSNPQSNQNSNESSSFPQTNIQQSIIDSNYSFEKNHLKISEPPKLSPHMNTIK